MIRLKFVSVICGDVALFLLPIKYHLDFECSSLEYLFVWLLCNSVAIKFNTNLL